MDTQLIATIVIAASGVVASFAVTKKQGEINTKAVEKLFLKSDKHEENISDLEKRQSRFLTFKDADEHYLRIKEFDRFEKHLDRRFDNVENVLNEIAKDMKRDR